MKINMLTTALLLISLSISCSTSTLNAQTQLDLNASAGKELNSKEEELSTLRKKLNALYSKDKAFLNQLTKSEAAWEKYKDEMLELKYVQRDDENKRIYYGSVYPMCYANYKAWLTQKHIEELKNWAEGTKEGNVCSGTLRIKE